MTRTAAVLALMFTPALCFGCVAPEVCADRAGYESLPGSTLSGEQTFTEAGEAGSVFFRATLRGLSELWPAEHAVPSAGVSVTLRLAYADESETSGVATQMPRFGVNLGRAASPETSYAHTTPAFPPSTGVQYHLPLFGECLEPDDLNCCEYGSTECSLDVALRYQRQDGAPFPPVVLRWEASGSAMVDTCPLAENAELVLEEQAP